MKKLFPLLTVWVLLLSTGIQLHAQPESFDSSAVVNQLFDESKSSSERQAVIEAHAGKAAAIVAALVKDLPAETSPEEYRRIPWIWRVALSAGKRNDANELKELLAVSLPQENEPLRDWQAVVIGGGIINGISLEGGWPGERIEQIIGRDRELKARWNRHLEQASAMADDEKVKIGTRYDALRMIALDTWEKRGGQLMKYMVRGTHAELQQGAVSGLVDVKSEKATGALLAEIEHLPTGNLNFALDGLLRTPHRITALLDAVAAGRVTREMVGSERIAKLFQHSDKRVRARAEQLFPEDILVLEGDDYFVGAAKIDITPDYPIRLNGYLARKTESEGVLQRIFAKALAIGTDREGPALLITVDNCGVPEQMRDELARRLKKRGVSFDKIAISASHTHAAPKIVGCADNIFGEDIPAEQQARIERYTRELNDKMEQVAIAALKDRKASKIHFGQSKADFAANRRTKGGPVDHDLPFLRVIGLDGKTRAVVANYACHCTTMANEPNLVSGDWAGYAQEFLERDNPGAVALTTIGCGADANPAPRPGEAYARQHGEKIASAIKQFSQKSMTPLHGRLDCQTKRVYLPFAELPTRAQFEEMAKQNDPTGYNARKQLARLDRGEKLMTELPYLVQSWNFGTNLAMVFLPGEVVVDYALRIKSEYDANRMWVTGYANDAPCYIPSKRILKEGGYEGGGAMIYYDKPTRFAEPVEEIIIAAVRDLVPKQFMTPERLAENPPPAKVAETYSTFHRKDGFVVSVVASEPLIVDPVAIDFGTDGRLWVLEMHDYPSGMDGNLKPGGRVKLLKDTNGDGQFDKASLFLDDLPFPTGLMQWRKGVLVCAAPDILYAEDTNGDGKADIVKKLFTGFETHNYQARVNSLRWGLDNWVYGSGGLFGGKIKSEITGKVIECSGRDFRMNPDTGAFEPVAGISQQGRTRDDFGNWFGCDNSVFLWHFPLPDRYVRRNPHVTTPDPRIFAVKDPQANVLFPVSYTMERFNNPKSANRATSVAGLEIYRDDLLGDEFYGNAFIGESVHNLVQRFVLTPDGATFRANRAEDEKASQFFSSTDNWFRPVDFRTGPDGALWIVDMYRFVIEHPRWIPEDRLATLDLRAGDDMGRIFKTYPVDKTLRPVRDLTKISAVKLAQMLDTPNGTTRDLIHREIYQRQDRSSANVLKSLAQKSKHPAVRVQALCVLDGINRLGPEDVVNALDDQHPGVRREALRLSEQFLGGNPDRLHQTWWNPALGMLREKLAELVDDPDYMVRYQLALTLGEWNYPDAGKVLAELAQRNVSDLWMRSAILTSAQRAPAQILRAVLTVDESTAGRSEMVHQLIGTGAANPNFKVRQAVIALVAPPEDQKPTAAQLSALATLLEALEKNETSLELLSKFGPPEVESAVVRIKKVIKAAGQIARDKQASANEREAALRIIGALPTDKDLATLAELATGAETAGLQKAALAALRKQRDPQLPKLIVPGWKNYLPGVRAQLLDFLLAREEGIAAVLDAIEANTISPAEISLNARQQLTSHSNEKLQKRAKKLFPVNESRHAVLSKFLGEVPTLTGNKQHGAELYNQMCANCHTLRGQGIAVGPDLTPIANKSIADFLVAILDPNAVIEPRFIQYNVDTRDDRSISGVLSAETATSVTLNQVGGGKQTILRSDIASMKASALSLMPEGLEEGRNAQDFADMIAFIQSASETAAPKVEAPKVRIDREKLFEGATNGIAKLISTSERLDYPSWIGVLPLAHCRQTDGKSKVVWQSDVMPDAIKLDQSYKFKMPVAMGLISQPSGQFQLKANGKSLLQFDVVLAEKSWASTDKKASVRYQPMETNAEDGSGVLTVELHGELIQPGKPVTFEVIGSATDSQRWFGVYLLNDTKTAFR